ncbi:MAG: RagB/SusD family nutrient uptake outer membrane protein [Bacteroidota bacterium]|nr:RagB/SusD family nutrient uptake outer membrane protein [Bacteroidota bacterium]
MKKINILFAVPVLLFISGCEKDYLERVPTSSVAEHELLSTVVGCQTLLQGIHRSTYTFYGSHDRFGQKSIDLAVDLLGEDFYQTERGYGWFVTWYQYLEHRNINSGNLEYVWSYYYDIVDNANIILVNIDKASDAAIAANVPKVQNIKAQCLTYRAFSFYQLVQLYASRYEPGGANTQLGIPLVLEPTQEGLPRSTVAEVYTRINKDLDDAIALFTSSTTSRLNKSEINLRVAQGIKARVALTTGQWAAAEAMSVAARTGFPLTTNYGSGMNSTNDQEWMWGAVLIDEQQTSYASFFSHIDPYFGGYATLGNHKLASTALYDSLSSTDIRKAQFLTIAGKPRVGKKFTGNGKWTNDYLYMKSGEMYLIQAEAIARQGGRDDEAQTVLYNLIVNRNPAYQKSKLTGEALVQHILMQRRCELWGEGFRFFDLKRLNLDLNRANLGHTESLWNAAGYFPAGDKNFIFLIPKQEIDANPKMVQNPL